MNDKPDYVTVSFSGGKDSTAMVLHMIELGEHIDEVVTVDTGMEFPAMYNHIARVQGVIESHGIKFTCLRAPHSFEWYMFEHEVKSKKYGVHAGHGWPTPVIRWCTGFLKRDVLKAYFKEKKQQFNVIECVGIAYDEQYRLKRKNNQQENHRHPLVEWRWNESDCLNYCYSLGYDWGNLYKIFNRVSCWCCPLQRISELRKLWEHYPNLFDKLESMENRLESQGTAYKNAQFTENYSVKQLRRRFEREARAKRNQSKLTDFDRENSPILLQNITIPDTPKKMESVSVGYRSENGKLDRGDVEH